LLEIAKVMKMKMKRRPETQDVPQVMALLKKNIP
jgi:hypothetical protein